MKFILHKVLVLLFLGQLNALHSSAQLTLQQYEDSLVRLADSFIMSPIPDDRSDFGLEFVKLLKTALKVDNSYAYPFEKLGQKIHILKSPDQKFRIFNWVVVSGEYQKRYYGAIQKSGANLDLHPLIDYSNQIDEQREYDMLTAKEWLGCEYYKIMPQQIDGQTIYLLFGFNTSHATSNKKLIDVLHFNGKGQPIFGAPIFSIPNINSGRMETANRFILEYKKGVVASLNYDTDYQLITFDHLESEINDPQRKNTYIPTGGTNGLRWMNNTWVYQKNVIPTLQLRDGEAPIDGVFPGSRNR